MRVVLLHVVLACVVCWSWTVVHAQTAPTSAPVSTAVTTASAAVSVNSDLKSFVGAYLVGCIVSVGLLGFGAWRSLRADVRALRARP
jgi:hypothetical protein